MEVGVGGILYHPGPYGSNRRLGEMAHQEVIMANFREKWEAWHNSTLDRYLEEIEASDREIDWEGDEAREIEEELRGIEED